MAYNVAAQRVNGLRGVENGVESTKLALRPLKTNIVRLVSKVLVCCVNLLQGIRIKMKCNNPTLVINRFCRFIFHRLGHIVNIDIVTEDLASIPVFEGNGRAGKANI